MVSRRQFSAALADGTVPGLVRTRAARPVRLLVVRKPGFSLTNACVAPCIRGKIYDVSDQGSLDLSTVTLSLLGAAICDTIELPWRGNNPSVSSIPVGEYRATVRDDATKDWMTNSNRRWRLELTGVPHRSYIQFHYGKDVSWSEGCFIVGDLLQPDGSSGMERQYCRLTGGEAAVARLRSTVTMPGSNPADVRVGVTDDTGLFPDFASNPTC